jgi:tRNA pseudouridine38-40 synthase
MSHKNLSYRSSFLISFAYDGAMFVGVQEQRGLKTVLGALRERISAAAGHPARGLFVAARTDRGVHALKNLATFYLVDPICLEDFARQSLSNRDDGLYVIDLKSVSPHVHARGNSRGKTYRYSVIDDCPKPEANPWAWQIAPPLNIASMREAALYFLGEQDFSSFRGRGCGAKNPLKNMSKINIFRAAQNQMVIVEITGNAFLRYMVRNMVGILLEIGAGLRKPSDMPTILGAKSREAAGIMAPAHGLCLVKVGFELGHGQTNRLLAGK